MKQIAWIALATASLLGASPALAAHRGPLRVVTSFPTEASLVKAVGGQYVEVTSLSKGNQDPHLITPRPSLAVPLNRADLLVVNGQDEDVIWLPTVVSSARNPNILDGEEGQFDPSEGATLLPYAIEELSQTPFFGENLVAGANKAGGGQVGVQHGNHHYLLDPANGVVVAHNLADKLTELDPDHGAVYAANFARFKQALEAKMTLWDAEMAPFKGLPIVSDHRDWTYLAARHGLELVGYVEPKEGAHPNHDDVRKLEAAMKVAHVKVVLYSNWEDAGEPQAIAKATGATATELPSAVGATAAITDYIGLFDVIYGKLVPALQAAK